MPPKIRRLATLAAALAAALTAPLLGAAAAPAAPSAIGCGTPIQPCLAMRDIVCWEDNWCHVPLTIYPYAGQAIRIGYATEDGTARARVNYLPARGTLSIEPQSTVASVPIFVGSATIPSGEPATLLVRLSAPSTGVLVDDTATVTIMPR